MKVVSTCKSELLVSVVKNFPVFASYLRLTQFLRHRQHSLHACFARRSRSLCPLSMCSLLQNLWITVSPDSPHWLSLVSPGLDAYLHLPEFLRTVRHSRASLFNVGSTTLRSYFVHAPTPSCLCALSAARLCQLHYSARSITTSLLKTYFTVSRQHQSCRSFCASVDCCASSCLVWVAKPSQSVF